MDERLEGSACPCGSGRTYGDCCGRYHDGSAWPADAEAMVRARYSAYAAEKWDFLVETHHPTEEEPGPTSEELESHARGVRWHSLKIVGTGSSAEDGLSYADFYAWYAMSDGMHQLGERAFFREIDGRLRYVGGQPIAPDPIRREGPKIGRNAPCPCGSGKKYKKCCGRSA